MIMKKIYKWISAYYEVNKLYAPRFAISTIIYLFIALFPFYSNKSVTYSTAILFGFIAFLISQSYIMYRPFNSSFRKILNRKKQQD